jgi:hypothetical protein
MKIRSKSMSKLPTRALVVLSHAALATGLLSCSSTPKADKGPESTKAFYVQVQASREGVSIETNNVFAGKAPFVLRLMGDQDGTFHNFGAPEYVVRAVPETTNAFIPTQAFKTGDKSSPGDRIPGLIFLDMSNPSGSFSVDTFPEK